MFELHRDRGWLAAKEGLRASVTTIFNESFSQSQKVWSQWGRSSWMGKARNGGTGRVNMLEDCSEPASPFVLYPP